MLTRPMSLFLALGAVAVVASAGLGEEEPSGAAGELKCKTDPVLSRLVLSGELAGKIDREFADLRKRIDALMNDPKWQPPSEENRRAMLLEARKQMDRTYDAIEAMLGAENKPRFVEGRKVVADSLGRMADLAGERDRALAKLPAGDDAAQARFYEEFGAKFEALGIELEAALDEKVGMVPDEPGSPQGGPTREGSGPPSRTDPLLLRLDLPPELASKVDALVLAYARKAERSNKELAARSGGALSPDSIPVNTEKVLAVRDLRIGALLPDGLREKFRAGAAIAADLRRKSWKLRTGAEFRSAMAGNAAEAEAIAKEANQELARLVDEAARQLDEKVGRAPGKPASGK